MSSIEVKDLRKVYGRTVAIDGVSFEVERGEVVGFLGPNGAGKTTTMKILSGFVGQTSGSARVDGLDVQSDSLAVRRRIGYLPESAPVYRDMLVDAYLRFICDVRGLGRTERDRRIPEVVDQTGLAEVLGRPIEELSRGFRQRVGLAQALVHDPPILILDEPTSGLDPNQIAGIRELIRQIGRTKTILLSTHILQEVQAVCGRILIVNRGRIVGFGTPAEIEARARGSSRIEVVVRGQGDLPARLAGLDGVREVRSAAGEGPGTVGCTVLADAERDPREAIFRAVVAEGWALIEMRREGQGLEDAFRDLTT